MRKTNRQLTRKIPLAMGTILAIGFSPEGAGQETARRAILGRGQERDETTIYPEEYNMQLGRARFQVEGSLDVVYNDNVNVSENSPQDDFILQPVGSVRSFVPLTERNTLTFGVGVGYYKYLQYDRYDQMYIAPESQLVFDVYVSQFRFSFYDEFSYVQDPTREGAISGSAEYGGFSNSAGMNVDWRVNEKLSLNSGYDHFNFISTDDEFEFLDRSTDSVPLQLSYKVSDAVKVGPELYFSRTRYDDDLLSSFWEASAGMFAEFRLTPRFTVRPDAGVIYFEFDEPGVIGSAKDVVSYYAGVNVSHAVNEHWSYLLSGGREIVPGINADSQELTYARLSVTWNVNRITRVRPVFFWEDAKDASGILSEHYNRIGIEPSIEVAPFERTTLRLAYRFTMKDSDRAGRDYEQNRVTVSARYTF